MTIYPTYQPIGEAECFIPPVCVSEFAHADGGFLMVEDWLMPYLMPSGVRTATRAAPCNWTKHTRRETTENKPLQKQTTNNEVVPHAKVNALY